MTISEYQTLARRTQNKALKWHDAKEHALCGLAAEVGEIHALHQKAHQGHPLLLSNLQEELGDLMWFVGELCDVYGLDLEEICAQNIEKLRRRYPEGFDEQKSLHRG